MESLILLSSILFLVMLICYCTAVSWQLRWYWQWLLLLLSALPLLICCRVGGTYYGYVHCSELRTYRSELVALLKNSVANHSAVEAAQLIRAKLIDPRPERELRNRLRDDSPALFLLAPGLLFTGLAGILALTAMTARRRAILLSSALIGLACLGAGTFRHSDLNGNLLAFEQMRTFQLTKLNEFSEALSQWQGREKEALQLIEVTLRDYNQSSSVENTDALITRLKYR